METAAREFVTRLEDQIVPAYRRMAETSWESACTGTREAERAAAEAETAVRRIFSSREAMAEVRRYRDSGSVSDPLLAREFDLLYLSFLGNQVDPERLAEIVRRERAIETEFSTFRAETRGRRYTANDVADVLRGSRDPVERREVWEASKRIGPLLAKRILELVRLRNGVARDLGFPNHYAMALELQEQSETEILAIADQFKRLSEGPFRQLRQAMDRKLAERFSITPSEIRPWHMEDPFFQEPPAVGKVPLDPVYAGRDLVEITRQQYRGIGLPVDACIERSDLFEREGKNPHAFCINIDRLGDVRVLCNVRPTSRWMETLLHEYGHAAYDLYVDPELPFILRAPAHTFTTEAVAILMGRQAREGAWLRSALGPGATGVDGLEEAAGEELRVGTLVATRWMLVVIRFERAMYADPDADLNCLWWDLVEEMQLLRRPDGRDAPDWASKIHIACYPVYYHNYLLGELFASQLRTVIERKCVGAKRGTMAGAPEVGTFLRGEIFRPGARWRWNRLVEKATGSPLGAESFVAQFVQGT